MSTAPEEQVAPCCLSPVYEYLSKQVNVRSFVKCSEKSVELEKMQHKMQVSLLFTLTFWGEVRPIS